MDIRITSIVGTNIYFLHKPEETKADTYLEYEIVRKEYDDYCGNDNLTENYIIQVDIFTKGSYSKLQETIEEVLKEKDYRFSQSADMYEEDTKLFHCGMRFNYKKN
jgi:1,2-phenylacetyl-CoA epoxidase catalytic subunit